MKHFFFSYDEKAYPDGILNGLFANHIKADSTNDETLKAFYDAADIIYDKRLEQRDEELKKLVNKNEQNNQVYELLDPYRTSVEDGECYRISALKMLWNYIEEQYKIFEIKNDIEQCKQQYKISTSRTLYHLLRGNICLRISQCYYENFDLSNSDIWGNMAIEILWRGKNLAASLRDSSPERTQADLYLRLIKLNLAKYYRDYARRNRRSDFDAALDEFKQVRQRVEDQIEKVSDIGQKRQYVLIWMDAIINVAKIHRRKYQIQIAKDETLFFYCCLKDRFQGKNSALVDEQDTQLFPLLIEKVNNLIIDDVGNIKTLLEHQHTKNDLPRLCEESFKNFDDLADYDRKRYLLLVLLELSRIYRDLHSTDNYLIAMATAIIADQWSYEMDKRENYPPGFNIDALNTISSSFRKYLKFQNKVSCKDELLNEIIIKVRSVNQPLYLRDNHGNKEANIATIKSFIQKLNESARDGHLKSKTEIIKWHCLYQQNQKLLECIKEEVGEYNSISNFLDVRNPNLQLRFMKGLVYLRSGKYIEAIEIFEDLVAPNNKETQYIRLGTIGLKARYLLANCYMALAEYSKAEKILKSLQEILKHAEESRRVQGISESTDADPDARIEIDLGYCYMQRGAYEEAFEIYKKLYNCSESDKNMPEFNLQQVKRERRLMGLNNYAACCIFSIDDGADREDRNAVAKDKIEKARKIFLYIDEQLLKQENEEGDVWYESNPETNLLMGYYTLCTGITPTSDPVTNEQVKTCLNMSIQENSTIRNQAIVKAHKYFREACRFDNAFTSRYNLLDENGTGNKAEYRNEVERISAYIINLTKLYKLYLANKNRSEQEGVKLQESPENPNVEILTDEQSEYLSTSKRYLERFILSFPTTYKISLKAAIALAEWLLERDKSNKTENQNVSQSKAQNLINQMYRSFSYITIYEERGAPVFNFLRDDSRFRLFTAMQRGKFLALLLAMYKPIKAIKEECCFNLQDKNSTQNLVHYTSIESLKNLLSVEILDDSTSTAEVDDLNLKRFEELYMMIERENTIPHEVQKKLMQVLYCAKEEELKFLKHKEHDKKSSPHFRINNCGYMNDVFEGNTFLTGIANIAGDKKIGDSGRTAFVKNFFPQINRSNEDMLPIGSNVYIGSLSIKEDSFPLWSVYAVEENGCNIEFGKDFFDINGIPYLPRVLRDYMLSKYTDQDYPLYIVQYIDSNFTEKCETYAKSQNDDYNDFEIVDVKGHKQTCGTVAIHYQDLLRLFNQIYRRWKQLNDYLEEVVSDSKDVIHAFAADRINEIRFLFKDADYEFEGEVRVIYTDFADSSAAQTDTTLKVPKVPRVYVDMDREIKDLTIRLGSKIPDATVDEYVTWLKHTKRVQKIGLAKRNRYTT